MSQFLNDIADFLVTQLELGIEIGEPSIVILINALIIAAVVAMALGRVRKEMRSQQWNNLTPEERREHIWRIAKEGWELAEWLLSDVKPNTAPEKRMVGLQKKKAAVSYVKREMTVLGANVTDTLTAGNQVERIAAEMKDGYARFSQVRIKAL